MLTMLATSIRSMRQDFVSFCRNRNTESQAVRRSRRSWCSIVVTVRAILWTSEAHRQNQIDYRAIACSVNFELDTFGIGRVCRYLLKVRLH